MKEYAKSDFVYTSLFCEENIWHLARSLIESGLPANDIKVIFLSNPQKSIALFEQQKAEPNHAIIWDYHVILYAIIDNNPYAFDFDSRLNFPTPANEYFSKCFPVHIAFPDELKSMVRLIPSETYLEHFYSDRSHMLGKIEEDEFPNYPTITPGDNNIIKLDEYWDMENQLHDNSQIFASLETFIKTYVES